jgi:hypothetical protein
VTIHESSPPRFFLRPMFLNEEDSPPPQNSSQAIGPIDIAYGAAAFVPATAQETWMGGTRSAAV